MKAARYKRYLYIATENALLRWLWAELTKPKYWEDHKPIL
jgi:hypothetical protein